MCATATTVFNVKFIKILLTHSVYCFWEQKSIKKLCISALKYEMTYNETMLKSSFLRQVRPYRSQEEFWALFVSHSNYFESIRRLLEGLLKFSLDDQSMSFTFFQIFLDVVIHQPAGWSKYIYIQFVLKGTHARDFIVRFSHLLVPFNNRQGRDPEFFKKF